MYLIVIAWMYVVLMMSIAEATNTTGTILGALVTFFLYGVGPVALLVYLMGAPARSKALKQRQAQAHAAYLAGERENASPGTAASLPPDAHGHATGGAQAIAPATSVAPVGKKP